MATNLTNKGRWSDNNKFLKLLRSLSKRRSKPFLDWRFFYYYIITNPDLLLQLRYKMNWVSTRKTRDQLTALEAIGVIVQSKTDKPKYRYHPLNATLGSMVEQLQ